MHFGKMWIIAGLLAAAIAVIGLNLATAEPRDTGGDNNAGLFSTQLGL